MNRQMALNFIRSAKAPIINAGVMIANMPWKIMNKGAGMPVPSQASCPRLPSRK